MLRDDDFDGRINDEALKCFLISSSFMRSSQLSRLIKKKKLDEPLPPATPIRVSAIFSDSYTALS